MAKPTAARPVSDEAVRTLLERYHCPLPFHEVRTRMLGGIATPVRTVMPINVMAGLWGGKLPTFDSADVANELLGALMMGLWNRLARHQNRSVPFRLLKVRTKPTREGLSALALMRCQELDGFVDGLFAGEAEIALPGRAQQGLSHLAEMRARFAVILDVAADPSIEGTDKDMKTTLAHLQTTTRQAEREIHAIIISCALARRQALASLPAPKPPTMH